MTAKPNLVAVPTPARGHAPRQVAAPGSRTAQADPRWPAIAAALSALRDRRRHAVRVVDADCACGSLLIAVARHARALGFTAIEVRGIDGSPAMIGRARAAAARLRDPAIGCTFDTIGVVETLLTEAEAPADIVLWHGSRPDDDHAGVEAALAAAGDLVIDDHAVHRTGARQP